MLRRGMDAAAMVETMTDGAALDKRVERTELAMRNSTLHSLTHIAVRQLQEIHRPHIRSTENAAGAS